MKKKVIAGLLLSSCVLGVAMPAFAQEIDGTGTADIPVNGTLGANNTEPEAEIPEGEEGWINVTVPTDVVFYNTTTVKAIKSPTYDIVNNSGRPVKVSLEKFENDDTNDGLELPDDYSLDLIVEGREGGAIQNIATSDTSADFDKLTHLVDLANVDGLQTATGTPVDDGNIAHFRFGGTADPTGVVQPKYTMTLKFDAVAWN